MCWDLTPALFMKVVKMAGMQEYAQQKMAGID